jgi:hypothetical protein
MGLTKSEKGSKTYLTIFSGKFAQKVNADTPNAIARENKNKQMIHELHYDALEGHIIGLKMESSDFGRQLVCEVQSGIDKFNLAIPMESKYFDNFCYKINSVNLEQEVKLVPYSFEPSDGKGKKTGINFYQNDVKLMHYYTTEDPKGKPFPEGKELSESKWKIYKLQERDWLADMIEAKGKAMSGAQNTPQVDTPSLKDFKKKATSNTTTEASDLPF